MIEEPYWAFVKLDDKIFLKPVMKVASNLYFVNHSGGIPNQLLEISDEYILAKEKEKDILIKKYPEYLI